MAITTIKPLTATTRGGYKVEITSVNADHQLLIGEMSVPPFRPVARCWDRYGRCLGDRDEANLLLDAGLLAELTQAWRSLERLVRAPT